MSGTRCKISARQIQREYGLTYKTAWRMVQKTRQFLNDNSLELNNLVTHVNTKISKNTATQDFKSPYQGYFPKVGTNQEKDMRKYYSKGDRTARLLKQQILMCQNPQGLSIGEIANMCSVSKRTAYRDLRTLESVLGVPVWEDGSKRGIIEGYFLSPVNLTLSEAINIFIALRLIQNFSPVYNPSVTATFAKLNTIVPIPLKTQIQHSLEYLEKQPLFEKRRIDNFNKLIQAWLSQHKVKILYKYKDEEQPTERLVEPLFIEPAAGASSYLIAFCDIKKAVCAFNLKHIVGEVNIEPDTYEIPKDFNAVELLGAGWGFHFDEEIKTVKLHFKQIKNRSMLETRLHPSQSIRMQSDGSIIITLKVRDSYRFCSWIMAWGNLVEVLEPEELRDKICEVAQSLVDIYKRC
jgi:predicted DNA-binding transcriptional regulator YafY